MGFVQIIIDSFQLARIDIHDRAKCFQCIGKFFFGFGLCLGHILDAVNENIAFLNPKTLLDIIGGCRATREHYRCAH